jgi:hypothetical protein
MGLVLAIQALAGMLFLYFHAVTLLGSVWYARFTWIHGAFIWVFDLNTILGNGLTLPWVDLYGLFTHDDAAVSLYGAVNSFLV